MDKYEYQAKLEEINKLVEKEDFEEAARLADTIEWKRVRSVRTLCTISEIYEAVGRVEDGKAILYRAYRRSPNSRQILYRLAEACVQTQDFDDAVEYYTDYVNLSPNDNNKYILKYEIYKGRGSSLEEQIAVLEEYKHKEYTEQWVYELAKLYDQAGMADACVAECDDLALWFHNGKYVVQALELKQKYAPLTPEQQTVYDNPSEIVDMETKEEVVEKAVPTLDAEITKEIPATKKDAIADSIIMDTEKEIAAAVTETKEETEQNTASEEMPEAVTEEDEAVKEAEELPTEKEAQAKSNPGFDAIGLQNNLANSMREILSGLKPAPKVQELDSVPGVVAVSEKEEDVPQQTPGQMSIDELLTQTTAGTPVTGAPTINLSESIRQEIGDKSLRDYMAEKTAAQQASAQTEAEAEGALDEEDEPEEQNVEASKPEVLPEAADSTAAPKSEVQSVQEPQAQPEEPSQPKLSVQAQNYSRRGLDDAERRMLGFWANIRGIGDQVNAAVTQVMKSVLTDKTSSHGNIIMVGDAGNGRTTLAVSIARIISRCRGFQTAKVAKIYAEDLNAKDIAGTVNKISGGVLIIEEAGDLSDAAISQLSMAMDFKTESLVVVLEDERRYLQDLLARNPQFSQKFDITINVPMLTNDELVEFGKYYAIQNDCVLDNTAVMTLYDGIGAMQSPEQPVAILDVKDVVDKAIRHASRFGVGKIFSSISGKRYDAEDRVIIKEKDFKKLK